MSFLFLFLAIICSFIILLLFYRLYELVLPLSCLREEEKEQSASFSSKYKRLKIFWQAYRHELSQAGKKPFLKLSFLCLAFYACLHLLFPFWGFAFFLRSDANFLVIIGTVFISLQLHHKLFSQNKAG